MSTNIKIESDQEYSYIITSTSNQSISEAYINLEGCLIKKFSEKFNFGFFLCDPWIKDSRLAHYFKLSKQKEYLSLFSEKQIKMNEGFTRNPNESNSIRYHSSFELDLGQLHSALKLNATNTIGHNFVFLMPKIDRINSTIMNDILKYCDVDKSYLNWLELEKALSSNRIFPIQKWDGDFEISLRINNKYHN